MSATTSEQAIPKISVVIPLYNKAPYIARAIDSVLNQTEQDFEIIVVNDASIDGGAEIVKQYSDKRIRLIHRSSPGAGGHAARNAGIKIAAAPYIAFLDADDSYNPDFLAVILCLTKKHEGAGAYGTSFEIVKENRQRIVWRVSAFLSIGMKDVLIRNYFQEALLGPVIWSSAVAIPRKIFNEVGFFPEGVQSGGDLDMWMRIGAKFPIAVSSYIGAVYHKDATNRIDTGRITGVEPGFVRTGLELLSAMGLVGKQRKHLHEFICMFQINTAIELILLGRRGQARKILMQTRTQRFFIRKLWWSTWTFVPTQVVLFSLKTKQQFVKRVKICALP